jgi:hypothetical protein
MSFVGSNIEFCGLSLINRQLKTTIAHKYSS